MSIERKRFLRYSLTFLILLLLFFMFIFININTGSVDVSLKEIIDIIFYGKGNETEYNVVWKIRLPRILAAAILGGALALSGFLLQTFFNNPIASPYVLGISSGAKLLVSLSMIYFFSTYRTATSMDLIIAAFIGSMISTGFVLLVSKKLNSMATLIVSGVMIGYICSAITDFVITFASENDIVNLHNWSMGSFSGMSWSNVKVMSTIVFTVSILVFFMSKPISAYQLGEAYAKNMGVNIKLFRTMLIILSSILSACVTAFAGPISFVGIAIPHLIKSFLNTSKPLLVIPGCFLGGAVFCLICDLIARTMFSPSELSISSVTAIFGAPIVILIMIGKNRDVR